MTLQKLKNLNAMNTEEQLAKLLEVRRAILEYALATGVNTKLLNLGAIEDAIEMISEAQTVEWCGAVYDC